MQLTKLNPGDQFYPNLPGGSPAQPALSYFGKADILDQPLLGVFCSSKVPASLILKAHDIARDLAALGQAVIGGFQSPVEREFLTVLLRGNSPIIICPARGLDGMRIPVKWRKPMDQGRLLILSPFPDNIRRSDILLTKARNPMVFALAQGVLVIHATPFGKLEKQCQAIVTDDKPFFTVLHPSNQNLINLGVQVWS